MAAGPLGQTPSGGRAKKARTALVAFAHVEVPDTHMRVDQSLRAAFVPGAHVERYNRTWYMGRVDFVEENGELRYVNGRIGFERITGRAPLWDDKRGDFVDSAIRAGATSPFSLSVRQMRIAFQLRSGTIKRMSFCGALPALLDEGMQVSGWGVEPEQETAPFPDWERDVERITKVRVVVRVPNPHYEEDEVEALLTNTSAAVASLELRGQNLDLNDYELLKEMLEHAARNDQYGYYTVEGVQSPGLKSTYDSRQDSVPTDAEAEIDAATREVPPGTLQSLVSDEDEGESQ